MAVASNSTASTASRMDSIAYFPLSSTSGFFLDWRVPVASAFIYFFTVKAINQHLTAKIKRNKELGIKPAKNFTDSNWFKAIVFLHNAALCVFSAACFLGMGPRWIKNMMDRPFHEAFCDRDSSVWNTGLFYWSWLFYLSKYYEIFDTIIILIKGRPSSLLQSYHHAGAIITMFLCVKSQATATWIFVVFNSFIHTIMYFYYACTTIGIHPPKRLKKMLTTMQISQFLIGGSIATSYVFIPNCLKFDKGRENIEITAYACTIGYLIPLTLLFVDFARRTYIEMSKRAAERKLKAEAEVKPHPRYPLRSRGQRVELEFDD
ncbi:hypothetical protein HDU97_000146 [Phlyctochytrium planicorne]|nr:hypothetical protein HDU97_000146 [Phlyctochytrium planicorne]